MSRKWWVSWYATRSRPFELHSPWWSTGWRMNDDAQTIVAAVIAPTEEAAREVILAAHDRRPRGLEWRFVNERPAGWAPFSDRFARKAWMRWPA